VTVTLDHDPAAGAYTLDPWPLRGDELEVQAEGRRLVGTFADDATLHAALETAPVVRLRFRLRRAG
jgi:hypothetical protein